jgi:GGDEF domain-containing protein
VTALIGASIGIAVGAPGVTADELVSEADRSMYAIKGERRALPPRPRVPYEPPVPSDSA